MKQKICHDNSCPPYDSYCTYCSRSIGCDSEDFREVNDGSPDIIHIDEMKRQEAMDIKCKEVAIGFFNDAFKHIEINGVLISNYFTPETEKIFEIYIQSKEK